MEENIKLDESTIMEEVLKNETYKEEKLPKIKPRKSRENTYKEKECKVLGYNSRIKALDVLFDSYGVRIKDVFDFKGDTVIVKYKGEIGKKDFEYKL